MTDTASQNLTETGTDRFVYEQLRQECLAYNRAIGSFNRHLNNHRDRMDLHDLPYRRPVDTPETPSEMRHLLEYLLGQVHFDSQVRRHPRIVPIHEQAVEHVEIARRQLLSTLEDELPP